MIVLRNRAFGLLWSGQLLSNVGNWVMIVAVPVYVFQLTGSALSTGLAFVAETLPALFLAPFAGVLVDRWDRRTVMVLSDVLRAGSVAMLLLVDDRSLLWLLYVVVFAENSFAQFFQPAHRALVPAIVGRDGDLESANAWYSVSSGVVRLVGAPLGGVLYAVLGFGGLVLVDAGTFLASAVFVALIGRVDRGAPDGEPRDRASTVRTELREGVVFLLGSPVLRGLLVVSSLFLLANAVVNVLLVPYVVDRLDGDSTDVGLMMSCLGVGYLVSAYLGSRISRGGRLRFGTVCCLLAITGCFAGLFNWPVLVAAMVFVGLAGAPGGALLMLVQVQLQRHTPDRVLGRISSAFAAGEMTATVIGAMVGSALAGPWGLVTTANTAIGLLVVAAAVAAVVLPRMVAVEAPPREALPAEPEPVLEPGATTVRSADG